MKRERTTGAWVALALMTLLLALCGYVGGYYLLCVREVTKGDEHYRLYRARWQEEIFELAATMDSLMRGEEVSTVPEQGW